ncbi:DUF2062 domain-containing protein [Robertmurraya korlensis]|uniref:DUF2062 domain-containing protein n=1 Tax=Robertmurraya korlensis TaxID=519977 RepID=UPI00203B8A94|nr:DUF2062 domain-containing protein [Robertmurraya korlensis]MCM3600916.1 DUF2062 domain-containing protein [Robertmurraya korlensis]
MSLRRRIKYYLLRLFRIKVSPQEVACGLALGFIPSWFPTFGLGPLLSIGMAKAFRVNVIAALIGGVIGTPIWPILFFCNYKVGSLILERQHKVDEIEDVNYDHVVNETLGSLQSGGITFLTGACVNMIISTIAIYIIVYILFKRYRGTILQKINF